MRGSRIMGAMATTLLMLLATSCGGEAVPTTPELEPITSALPTSAPAELADPTPEPVVDFESNLEDFDPTTFDNPIQIDNQWFPLQPGTHYIYEGVTQQAERKIPHRIEFIVTDLIKEIAGVPTVVAWILDYSDNELVEAELAFYAQDNDGNVWFLGEYPEVYELGKFVEAPAWITGFKGARAGIAMQAAPEPGTPSYSQGWGPAVNWTDRGQIVEMGQQTCVAADCYQDVLVAEEFSQSEPDAYQVKYYAPGVGNVRVSWRGEDATKEELELVEFIVLDQQSLEQIREAALEMEKHAYEVSREVYDETPPATVRPPSS